MLELFTIAADPFGTWGPGPIPEPVGYWTRILDSVANDPQAVVTILAAFFGFVVGVLSKYGLERLADHLRRETDRRALSAALRAELLRLDVECGSRIKAFEKLLGENPHNKVLGGPWSFAQMALPPRRVWMALLDRIGELEDVHPDSLVLVYSLFDSYDLMVEVSKQQSGGGGVPRQAIQGGMDALTRMRDAISEVGGALVKQTNDDPPWWRRILRS